MPSKKISPYGSWKSPITAEMLTQKTIGLGEICVSDHGLYWIEGRPEEAGRNVIVHRTPSGQIADILPPPFHARSRVHEYGGGAFTVFNDVVYFTHFEDQQIYRTFAGQTPQAITQADGCRFADYTFDSHYQRLIGICETHHADAHEPTNSIVGISLTGDMQTLVSGSDFYASPRVSPDGTTLAWISWEHPNMPWDTTALWIGTIQPDGRIGQKTKIAGGLNTSVSQPKWSPNGTLYFISDQSQWWNLYCWTAGRISSVYAMEAEFTGAQWGLGLSTYDFASDDQMICTYTQNGQWHLAVLDLKTQQLETLDLPYVSFRNLQIHQNICYAIAAKTTDYGELISHDMQTKDTQTLRQAGQKAIVDDWISIPESIAFPTENEQTAYGFYYAPQNPDFHAKEDEQPPLIIMVHGGPTGSTDAAFSLSKQFWTSRGFAVLDVNYRGSTGYGRGYRDALKGQWGIADVEDAANGVRYLVQKGKADAKRIIIRGGSAGGYTALIALALNDTFKAGTSLYGISDLELLAKETHKFESRYLDQVVGPYPERRDVYVARSALTYRDQFNKPTLFLQGLDDKVVLPNQAEMMVDALKKNGVPVAYLAFAGEGHGFRKAENIIRAHQAELYFYAQIFGFPLADDFEPIEIENLTS